MQAFLDRQRFIVLDGGLATELELRGERLNDSLWSARVLLHAPEKIEQVHYEYFSAGADIATTASYQATFPGLRAKGLTQLESESVFVRSVELASAARARFWSEEENRVGREYPLIAASVGPYGAYLHDGSEYRGDYGKTLTELKDFHRGRLALLAESGADLLACESIPSRLEAQALAELLNESPGVPAWLSFTCRDENHISDGHTFAEVVQALQASREIVALGVNCTPPRFIGALLESARHPRAKPFVVYPNSGEIYDIATSGWLGGPDQFDLVPAVADWYRHGARIVGGCCRTTPETVRRIRSVLEEQGREAGVVR